MPNPTRGQVYVSAPLGNISVRYQNQRTDYVADRVFPSLGVDKQAGMYFQYAKGDWFRTVAKARGLSEESAGSGYRMDDPPTYFCKPEALHKDVDDQMRANQQNPLNLDRDATEFVTNGMLLKRELNFAAAYFVGSVWYDDVTPGTLWSAANSTPIVDIRAQMAIVKTQTGLKPNTLTLSSAVWNILQDHVNVTARIKSTVTKVATTDLLANILELDRVLVAGAVQNTAAEGQTAVMADIFGNHALLTYSAPRPSLLLPSAGYTFNWTGWLGATANGTRIKRFRIEEIASDRIEGEMASDQKLVAADCGIFFEDVIA